MCELERDTGGGGKEGTVTDDEADDPNAPVEGWAENNGIKGR